MKYAMKYAIIFPLALALMLIPARPLILADSGANNDYKQSDGAPPVPVQVRASSNEHGADADGLARWLKVGLPASTGPTIPVSVAQPGAAPSDPTTIITQQGQDGGSSNVTAVTVTNGAAPQLPSDPDAQALDAALAGPLPGEKLVPLAILSSVVGPGQPVPTGYRAIEGGLAEQPSAGAPSPASPSVPPIPPVPVRLDPREVAMDVRAHVGLPDAQIEIDPDIGLVGLPEYAWLAGYDGGDLMASRTIDIPPVVGPDVPVALVPADDSRRQGQHFTVSVKLSPTGYTWDFGDGTPALTTSSLGQAYPRRSPIQHTYQRSSKGHPDGYAIAVTAHFVASYRVDGGGWQPLPPVDHTYVRTHVVQQVQTVLVDGR